MIHIKCLAEFLAYIINSINAIYYHHFDYDYLISGQGAAEKCLRRMSGMTRFVSFLKTENMPHTSLITL